MHNLALENILEAELNAHLAMKNTKKPKMAITERLRNQEDEILFWESEIKVHTGRTGSLEPTLFPKDTISSKDCKILSSHSTLKE